MTKEIKTDQLGFLLADTTRLLKTAYDRQLRASGLCLSRSQWRVIAYLHRGDGQSQTELADLMEMEKAPLGSLIDKLESGGLVRRVPDPEDRRAKRLFLTEEAKKLYPKMRRYGKPVRDKALEGLNDAEIENLFVTLETVKQNLIDFREKSK